MSSGCLLGLTFIVSYSPIHEDHVDFMLPISGKSVGDGIFHGGCFGFTEMCFSH